MTNNRNDEFFTPNYAIDPIIKYIPIGSKILCPFDTEQSNFIKYFNNCARNYKVTAQQDFFNLTKQQVEQYDYIISNPPCSVKGKVFEKLFELGKPFGMLVNVVGLFESKHRFNMFANNDFEIMYFDKRIAYNEPKPSLNPSFSSIYLCHKMLPKQIVFERVLK